MCCVCCKDDKQQRLRSGLIRCTGLADGALKALEAQTKEAAWLAWLMAYAAGLEEAHNKKEQCSIRLS